MLKIEDGVIYLTKGDDAVIDVQVTNLAGEEYSMQSGDILTLTVRKMPEAGSPVIFRAESEAGTPRIVIKNTDTAEADPGKYSADVQLTAQDGKRYTVWPDLEVDKRSKIKNFENFVIMPEVTES